MEKVYGWGNGEFLNIINHKIPTGGDWPCDGEIDIMEQWGNNYLTGGE